MHSEYVFYFDIFLFVVVVAMIIGAVIFGYREAKRLHPKK